MSTASGASHSTSSGSTLPGEANEPFEISIRDRRTQATATLAARGAAEAKCVFRHGEVMVRSVSHDSIAVHPLGAMTRLIFHALVPELTLTTERRPLFHLARTRGGQVGAAKRRGVSLNAERIDDRNEYDRSPDDRRITFEPSTLDPVS